MKNIALVMICSLILIGCAGGTPLSKISRQEHAADWILKGEPSISVSDKFAAVKFNTTLPARVILYYGLYVPDQEIKVPQYRFERNGVGTGMAHSIALDISVFEKTKYDICNFAEDGGVVCYRIEAFTDRSAGIIYNGRFRVDGEYNRLPCITLGPFVDCITTSSAIISWDTDIHASAKVVINGREYSDTVGRKDHEIYIYGLSQDTGYTYDVFADGIMDFKRYHFNTSPLPDNSNFTFAYLSDSRSAPGGGSYNGVNYQVLTSFMQDIYNNGGDIILFGGDLINGYTTSTEDFELQLKAWKDATEQVGCYIPIYECMGNHEALIDLYVVEGIQHEGADICETPRIVAMDKLERSAEDIFAARFVNPANSYPERETLNAPTYRENVYYFDYGNSRFISVNTNYWYCAYPEDFGGNLEGYVMDNQLEWIEQVLIDAGDNSSIEHVFIFAHEPAFPNGGHKKDAQWYDGGVPGKGRNHNFEGEPIDRSYVVDRRDELWEAISRSGKVVAVFFGDEHNYHRTLITDKTRVYLDMSPNDDFKNPVWQIISGGAGAPFYAQEEMPWTDWVESFYPNKNYCLIDVNGDEVTMKVINDSGEIVDQCTLKGSSFTYQ